MVAAVVKDCDMVAAVVKDCDMVVAVVKDCDMVVAVENCGVVAVVRDCDMVVAVEVCKVMSSKAARLFRERSLETQKKKKQTVVHSSLLMWVYSRIMM